MGKPRYWWYSFVRDSICRYKIPDETPMARHMRAAVDAALAETRAMTDGTALTRVQLIRLMYINRTCTLSGAAWQLSISERTAQRYIAAFVYLTAAYAGFRQAQPVLAEDRPPWYPRGEYEGVRAGLSYRTAR